MVVLPVGLNTTRPTPRFGSVLINPKLGSFKILNTLQDEETQSLQSPHPDRVLQITGDNDEQWVFREFEPLAQITAWANVGHAALQAQMPQIVDTLRSVVEQLPRNTRVIDTDPANFAKVVKLVDYTDDRHAQVTRFLDKTFDLAPRKMMQFTPGKPKKEVRDYRLFVAI